MALAMQTTITAAGLAAAVDAQAHGLELALDHVFLGDGAVAPSEASAGLGHVRMGPIPIASFSEIDPATLELVVLAEPTQNFRLTEIGWFTASGILVAVSFRAGGIVDVSAGVSYPLSLRLSLMGLPEGSVTVTAGAPVLDLPFLGLLAVLGAEVARLRTWVGEHEIRTRTLEGRSTAHMRNVLP